MDQFYMIVLGAIGVLLIIMLTAVGLLMYSTKSKPEAPIRSPCPDYWVFDGVGCKLGSVNTGELTVNGATTGANSANARRFDPTKIYYTSQTSTPDDTLHVNPTATEWAGVKYKGLTEVCAKGKWATDLGIVWDGYTNTTEC
jgi:hypothetical protein